MPESVEIESVTEIIHRAKHKLLHEIPEAEWPSIWDTLNDWRWDIRLGKEPADWDTMKEYAPPKRFLCFRKKDVDIRTKDNIIRPINQANLPTADSARERCSHNLGLKST